MTKSELESLLWTANTEPIGLVIATNDPQRLRQRLYAARAAAGPALSDLQIRLTESIEGFNLVICHRRVKIGDPP